MTRDKIKAELQVQQMREGSTPETELLLKVLPMVRTAQQWRILANCELIKTGPRNMIDCIRFYYPSQLLKDLQQFFIADL